MLDSVDLTQKLRKKDYKAIIAPLQLTLGALQRTVRAQGVPVVIVFEGWDASGKGTQINHLILALDSRGYSVHTTGTPNEEEALRPFLWRFAINLPAKGRIAVFDRSWYRCVLHDRLSGTLDPALLETAFDGINAFERRLTDDGTMIIKLFLHISKKEQKERFDALRADKNTAWRVTADDKFEHRRYKSFCKATDEMLARTSTANAPWTVIAAHDRRHATVRIFETVTAALEQAVVRAGRPPTAKPGAQPIVTEESASVLDGVDLDRTLTRPAYERRLKRNQKRLNELGFALYRTRLPVIILYEGWDAAGKGGNIRRLVQALDPRGYEVVPVSAPTEAEKAHHYLHRFWMKLPKAGHVTIFDRTWYGRVLVERVEGFCTTAEWQRAYREINEFEQHLVRFGCVLVKFWLQIDQEEQLRRFKAREKNPYKQWKITDEDWRNREKWAAYEPAVNDMLSRTSTEHAPWTIVEANDKLWARIKAQDTVIAAIEATLKKSHGA